MKILVIDDDPRVSAMTKEALCISGHSVTIAYDQATFDGSLVLPCMNFV